MEVFHNKNLERSFEALISQPSEAPPKMRANTVPKLEGFNLDDKFGVIAVPQEMTTDSSEFESDAKENLYDTEAGTSFNYELDQSTYIVRGEVDEDDLENFQKDAFKNKNVVEVYADPEIEPTLICPVSPPLGSDKTVEKLLNVSRLHNCKADGSGVRVAIVDTGVNMAYLNSKGKRPRFDSAGSWKPASSSVVPGSAPVGHGTMCAYDVCIAAPKCTILDIALLTTRRTGRTVMEGFLSDAILAYRHLIRLQRNISPRPGVNKSLVVNNSWGMFHPSWDFPVGHPGNYSDNPNHPFNRIVRSLERCGADILFAAGNCGSDCPDGRCRGVTSRTIYGANSSPHVLTVAGVDTSKKRVGYSSKGPGRLVNKKPDVSGYTHFQGSGVYAADGGTSAACPVVAGMVAAIRTKRPYNPFIRLTSPAAIRSLVRSTAQDLGPTGFDYGTGYGVVNGSAIANKLKCPIVVINICKRYPRLCYYYKICRRYPWLCKRIKPKLSSEDIEVQEESIVLTDVEMAQFDLLNQFTEDQLDFIEQLLPDAEDLPKSPESDQEKSECNCKG